MAFRNLFNFIYFVLLAVSRPNKIKYALFLTFYLKYNLYCVMI